MAQEAADHFRLRLWIIKIHFLLFHWNLLLIKVESRYEVRQTLVLTQHNHFNFHLLFSPCIGDLHIMAACMFHFFCYWFQTGTIPDYNERFCSSSQEEQLHILTFKISFVFFCSGSQHCLILHSLYWQFFLDFSTNKFFLPLQTDITLVTCDYLETT